MVCSLNRKVQNRTSARSRQCRERSDHTNYRQDNPRYRIKRRTGEIATTRQSGEIHNLDKEFRHKRCWPSNAWGIYLGISAFWPPIVLVSDRRTGRNRTRGSNSEDSHVGTDSQPTIEVRSAGPRTRISRSHSSVELWIRVGIIQTPDLLQQDNYDDEDSDTRPQAGCGPGGSRSRGTDGSDRHAGRARSVCTGRCRADGVCAGCICACSYCSGGIRSGTCCCSGTRRCTGACRCTTTTCPTGPNTAGLGPALARAGPVTSRADRPDPQVCFIRVGKLQRRKGDYRRSSLATPSIVCQN
jgi:hypothetical protein